MRRIRGLESKPQPRADFLHRGLGIALALSLASLACSFAFGWMVGLPLLLALALIVKLTSRGPVLFRQIRCGLNGRPFTLLKLRTMVADAEARRPDLLAQGDLRWVRARLALVASITGALIIIAVYIPVFTLEGLEGKMFRPVVMSLVSFIGPRPNLLSPDSTEPVMRLEVSQPILTFEDMEKLRRASDSTRRCSSSSAISAWVVRPRNRPCCRPSVAG